MYTYIIKSHLPMNVFNFLNNLSNSKIPGHGMQHYFHTEHVYFCTRVHYFELPDVRTSYLWNIVLHVFKTDHMVSKRSSTMNIREPVWEESHFKRLSELNGRKHSPHSLYILLVCKCKCYQLLSCPNTRTLSGSKELLADLTLWYRVACCCSDMNRLASLIFSVFIPRQILPVSNKSSISTEIINT